MEPTGKIPPQPWMTAPETRAVMAALTAEGGDARFVGGCVRDAILKRPVKDVDIATHLPPAEVMRLLRQAGIRAIPTGLDHGTVTAVAGKAHYEITTLREDIETDGRRARVAFTDDWMADAARRDFTINAMFCDVAGNVYDPFGGLDDLGQGAVRFVGDPRQRIEEDVLRLLRFFRFFAYYGRPPPDVPALAACRQLAHRLPELSGERVRGELFRILMAPDPAAAVNLMRGERVLEHILPEAGDVGRLRMMVWLETSAIKVPSVAPDEVRRLAALVVTDAAGAERVADRLKLSNVARYRLIAMAAPAAPVTPELDSRALRRTLRRLGADTARDLVLLQWAGRLAVAPRQGEGGNRRWTDLLAAVDAWRPVELPIKGRDALALGVPHGPRVGALLARVEAWWEAEDYRPDRAACLERLKETLAAAG